MVQGTEWDEYRYTQARRWLDSIKQAGQHVGTLKAMIEAERDLMDGVRGINYAAVPGGGSDDSTLEAIERIRGDIQDYTASLNEYLERRHDAQRRIERLEDKTEARALMCRYLLGWPWSEIETHMSYSHAQVMRIHYAAVVHVYDFMPHSEREPIHKAI